MMTLATWMPFIYPINALFDVWYLLAIPLAFGISMIYKALRMPPGRGYWIQVAIMTIQIVFFMIALAVVLGIFVQWIIPMMRVS